MGMVVPASCLGSAWPLLGPRCVVSFISTHTPSLIPARSVRSPTPRSWSHPRTCTPRGRTLPITVYICPLATTHGHPVGRSRPAGWAAPGALHPKRRSSTHRRQPAVRHAHAWVERFLSEPSARSLSYMHWCSYNLMCAGVGRGVAAKQQRRQHNSGGAGAGERPGRNYNPMWQAAL